MSAEANPAATSFPAPIVSLPVGLGVLRTYSGALMCLEIFFGGLVWILVAASSVPVPLLQGWVMFVSVTTFACSAALLLVFLLGFVDRINTDWNFLDMAYHLSALLLYFGAFLLEAAVTGASTGGGDILTCTPAPGSNIIVFLNSQQYCINVVATIFAFLVTIFYGCSMFMGFKRWRK